MATRDELFNQVVQFGLKNKKNKKDMARAMLSTGQFSMTEIGTGLKGLEDLDLFEPDAIELKNVTPQGFAASLNDVDQSELSGTQNAAFGFGRRMNVSGEIISSLENKIGEKGFLASVGQSIDEFQVGKTFLNRFVPQDFQKFDQAKRDFINATLRRESGAAIAPSEFENAEIQYFPVPGDSKDVLEQKRKNRDLITRNFLGEAGVKTPDFNEGGVNQERKAQFDQLMTFALANPNDGRSKKLLQMVDEGKINVATGEMSNAIGLNTSPINELNEQRADEEEAQGQEKGFLTKAGETVGGILGGKQIGKAIGDVAGGQIAKFGEAGKIFENTIKMIEEKFQAGEIDQERRDKMLNIQEEAAKDAFGYDGPSFTQIAGDVAQIGLTFAGGAALKGGATVAKLAGVGAAAGVAGAAAEGEDLKTGAVTGAVLGGALGVFGKVAGKAGKVVARKIDDFTDLGARSEKLATEILQPTKTELASALEKGGTTEAVKALVNNVKKARDFGELRATMRGATEAIFEKRNNLIKTDNFDVSDYLKPLQTKISEIEKGKLASPAQINKMKDILAREESWITEQGGKISRVDAQTRKEAIQDLTQPLLKKKIAGNLAQDEANDKIALDAIRKGLKEAVEGGNKEIVEINSQYAGLKRVQELLSGQEALALKAKEQGILQKIAAPIVELISASTGAGSAAFVARQAAKSEAKLIKLTTQLEKLSTGKGGVFADMMDIVRRIKDSIGSKQQGAIGNFMDDLDEATDLKNLKPGMTIKETSPKFNELQRKIKEANILKAKAKTPKDKAVHERNIKDLIRQQKEEL